MQDASQAIRRSRSKDTAGLLISRKAGALRWLASSAGHSVLFMITLSSAVCILFIFYYIIVDSIPFFRERGFREFFTSTAWQPSLSPPAFGALAIFFGSGIVTLGATLFAVPLGVVAAVCLSDILPFRFRQWIKPVIEILAAIPSVAFGFFALVVFAPLLQERGGEILGWTTWVVGVPTALLGTVLLSDMATVSLPSRVRFMSRLALSVALVTLSMLGLAALSGLFRSMEILSGTNAFNVSIVLGIMALPTIISVSEDALQSVGRELREGAYALGATRAETLVRVVVPAAKSGIAAAVILGVMRAIGETMVVWMASGNATQIPSPWYDFFAPVRTLTATIAGDMGEADHMTGSARYHGLFAMALCLLTVSYCFNYLSEIVIRRSRLKRGR